MAQRGLPVVVVMGVSGSGKSTVGRALAAELGVEYAEGDEFHPEANIAKMAAGIPLDDADRAPWLDLVAAWMGERTDGGVVTCSALKRVYRDRLRAAAPDAFFLHLAAPRDELAHRMADRTGHFMPSSLLDSQLAALEPLAEDERGQTVDATRDPADLARETAAELREL
ncbi:gluconokinase [Nocardia tenerifensis]|uniref:Gluconokinase n=1 Tax=Nocardia tenerifensis TaxID=228006 RepID=A0A318JTF7_9NOCA|nr:gluconokinase [Nocardia tenerifensis]PXX58680.1 gluconokinase [Nocardia tenerifensis]